MTLRLTLVRHAKSDWGDSTLPDHDRPLNERGRKAAHAVGRWLDDRGNVPERALVSTAKRAAQTWRGFEDAWGEGPSMTRLTDLYHATPETILDALASVAERRVMVIAHNPGLAALAQWLVDLTPNRVDFHRYPTGATLVLEIDREEWAGLDERCARLVDFVVPRDLTDRRPPPAR